MGLVGSLASLPLAHFPHLLIELGCLGLRHVGYTVCRLQSPFHAKPSQLVNPFAFIKAGYIELLPIFFRNLHENLHRGILRLFVVECLDTLHQFIVDHWEPKQLQSRYRFSSRFNCCREMPSALKTKG